MLQESEKNGRIKSIYAKFDKLVKSSESGGQEKSSIAEQERRLLSQLLAIGKDLLDCSIKARQAKLESLGPPVSATKAVNKGKVSGPYQSIFGQLEVEQRKYLIPGKGIYYPLSVSLGLPNSKQSYVLQDWLGSASTEVDYRESVRLVNSILGLSLNPMQSKHHISNHGKEVSAYYEQKQEEPVAIGQYICIEWDGKGVPIKQSERTSKETIPSTAVVTRLKKGQKRGIKKSATVSVVSDFTPKQRDKSSIIRGLFKTPLTPLQEEECQKKSNLEVAEKKTENWHQHIHRRAFLANQQKAITYGLERVKTISGGRPIPVVALVDGGSGLEPKITAAFEQAGLTNLLTATILDIVHVSEYVWKAGNAILGENSKLRTAWVKQMLTDLLDSKVSIVIEDLIANRDKTNLSNSAKEQLNKTISYFTNHQHKMDYKTYLQQGLPVSTALVESSCGHLVKDRMEGSGRRWSMKGAQNMLDARAVKKNGDWEDFMQFVIRKEQAEHRQKAA